MATTIPAAFSQLRSNLEITGLQGSTVSTRQQGVRETMNSGFQVLEDFLTGSYARSTMIAPLAEADIDVFVVLDPAYHKYGPAGLLNVTKRTLLKTYTKTPDISRNGQAVTIRFSDFVVDVVPGFYRNGGGYLIPNSIAGNWLETDPKKHVTIMTDANKAHSGDLVPLIKMIKGWNRSGGSFFRSFHLEALALEALNNVRITDFPSGLRFFFDKARTLVRGKNPDPAGYGDDIGSYINSVAKVEEAVRRFATAHEKAMRAEQFAVRNQIGAAFQQWQQLIPDYFPTYG
jgi:Second Messenger Oligonucleotide or Dinucleotide Synthetase domain